jgi:hypothetical protein
MGYTVPDGRHPENSSVARRVPAVTEPAARGPVRFEGATAVRPAGGGYHVDLDPAFAIAGTKPNGGYLLACLGRAALAATAAAGSSHVHVVAAGGQYLSSPDVGPAHIDVEVLRAGRTASQVRARLTQDGVPGVDAKFTLATLPAGTAPYWGGTEVVRLPPIEACEATGPFAGQRDLQILFDPDAGVRWTPDGPVASGAGEIRAWFDPGAVPLDTVTLMFVADALPPATFGIVTTGWVPTLDLTAYVRAFPEPGPLRLRFRARMVQDGFADETLEAWDSADRLVLQSTQLVALRLPPGTPR